jgi:hypothetical protein
MVIQRFSPQSGQSAGFLQITGATCAEIVDFAYSKIMLLLQRSLDRVY